MKAYKLKFHSSFHIDAGTSVDGPSETFIRSDTLFSAIVSATKKFYGNEIAEKFIEEGSLILSSAFPYYKEEYFLPKPLNFFPSDLQEYEMIKVFKKAKFISKDLLLNILAGKEIESKYFSKDYMLNECWRIIQNITNKNKKDDEEEDKIFEKQEVPHIVMDRITNQTQIFYKSEVYFNKNAGLYFLAEIKDELIQKFETVLRFLGDEGIGADRTIGKGMFEVEIINDFPLLTFDKADYFYSLSLYSPSKEEFNEINPHNSYYDFIIRGGWISNKTLNRKNLRMFVEGSVLNITSKKLSKGRIHKVLEAKDYPNELSFDIYRSGQALFLPVNGGSNGKN
ncbi:type III-A CRISPR-associated RAMP protein Csm4 [Ignavibacterium sp.]|uniref:type III-A CRISPR-associated RAMP protein Csm4 n=1 Tax=Ignavibacterium sp. TaxID=2651167 RepID=UPI00307DA778